ncbi:hypothetical protein, partial [Porphyromonas loveana]|uniref:hypothetical protein n=1 Tax=Porphyromonas loveana TaxID=1884669 RepID=UPI0035A1B1AC
VEHRETLQIPLISIYLPSILALIPFYLIVPTCQKNMAHKFFGLRAISKRIMRQNENFFAPIFTNFGACFRQFIARN